MKLSGTLFINFILLLSCNSENTTGLESLAAELTPIQTYTIKHNSDTMIQGKQGTKIFIAANSFVDNNNLEPDTDISISLKEVYAPSEIIVNNLSTTVNGRLLETSGMILLEASIENSPLKLKDDTFLKIGFKKISESSNMQTFLGLDNGNFVEWEIDKDNTLDTMKFTVEATDPADISNLGDTYDIAVFEIEYEVVGLDTFLIDTVSYYDSTFTNNDSYYFLHSTRMGWINCDYFRDLEDGIELIIDNNTKDYISNYLIFHDINSIMQSWEFKNGITTFRNIPRNSEVTILSTRWNDSDYFVYSSPMVLKKDKEQIKIELEKLDEEEFLERLKELDVEVKSF